MNQIKTFLTVQRNFVVLVFFFYSINILPQSLQNNTAAYELTGIVKDESGTPISGVLVSLQEESGTIRTNKAGVFKLQILKSDVLIFRHTGYKTQSVLMESGAKNVTIVMKSLFSGEEPIDVAFGSYPARKIPAAFSKIDEEVVRKNAVNTIEQSLNGTLSGLYSISNGGQKFGKSNYEFYVRGVATTGNANPLILVDGIDGNINLLDPKEVESVTVIKDASELAMYGMRGANGVILIKTKRGNKSIDFMNVDIRTGFQTPSYISDKLNAYQYTKLHNEANTNDGNIPVFNADSYINPVDTYRYPDTNFPDQFLRKDTQSAYQNFNFSSGGGNDIAQYYCLVGYMKQGGLFTVPTQFGDSNQTSNERYNFRTNIDVNLGKGFVLNTNIAAINDERKSPWLGSANNVANSNNILFNSIMNTPAIAYPIINPDESLGGTSEYQSNILGVLQSGNRDEITRQLSVKIKLSKDLSEVLKGLSANAIYSFENYNSYYEGRYNRFAVYQLGADGTYTKYGVDDTKVTSVGGQISDYYSDVTIMAGLDYNATFGNHQVTTTVTTNQYTSNVSGDNPDYKWLGTSGRFLYGFKNRYYAQLTGSYQGSNSFATGKRYGFFPAAGLSWIVSEEDFLKSSKIVQNLKFRASYGVVGNDMGASRYMHRQAYYKSNGYGFGNPNGSVPGVYEGTLGNPNATWETAYKSNVGLDLSVFKNTLTFSADYFDENRKNIFISQANLVPELIGINLPMYNAGNITNKGFEFELNYYKKIGNLHINAGGNLTTTKNNVLDLKEVAYSQQEQYRYRQGNQVDTRFGLVADGIYQNKAEIDASGLVSSYGNLTPGDIKYKDLNSDGIINDADRKAIGNTLPKTIYGIHLGIEYKGFDFYSFGEGATDYNVHIRPNQFSTYAYDNRWSAENSTSQSAYPRLSLISTHNQQTSTFWQEKGNMFRLSTLEIGYTMPDEVVRTISLSKIRLFFNANNMFSTVSSRENRDFEASNAGYSEYPTMKTFLFGLSVNL
jgi:TonB-linked SusC/RagA family outer membrane protein